MTVTTLAFQAIATVSAVLLGYKAWRDNETLRWLSFTTMLVTAFYFLSDIAIKLEAL